MTTVLVIGDPHIKIENIHSVNTCLEKLIKLAVEKKPDFIVILGDILDTHERLHTTTLNKAYELVDKMRNIAETYILVGNHDAINNQIFLSQDHWMNGMKEWQNVTIVDTVITINYNKDKFVFVPYVPPGRFEEALDTLTGWNIDTKCIFAHQEFFGCKMGAIVSVEGDKWSLDYPAIISGHIHSNQQPQKNVYYPGSMLQHAFGESKRNIIACIIFTESSSYDLEEIDLKLPRKKIVYVDVEDIDEYKLPETKDNIKITVSGGYEQFKALKKSKKYKSLLKSGAKIVFKAKKITHEKSVPETVVNEMEFRTILSEIINQQKNSYLNQSYELVVNNKTIKSSDIMYID
jgi:DNA repair exonuclease SbcCD nuclease subunit